MITVSIVAAGEMGSVLAQRMARAGARVMTSLAGRSEATRKRIAEAGIHAAGDAELVAADYFLSVVPPSQAEPMARRFAVAVRDVARKCVYVDCNAVEPRTAHKIAAIVEGAGARFIDGAIIGVPGLLSEPGPTLYLSGESAQDVDALVSVGLKARSTGGPAGSASALKMAYGGLNKGITGLGAAMVLAATRAGVADAFRNELLESQPQLLKRLGSALPDMYHKAYRWDFEMAEVAAFASSDEASHQIFQGIASLFAQLAQDWAGDGREIAEIDKFLAPLRDS